MTVHLRGQGVNPHWDVHRSLEAIQGFQKAALMLIKDMDRHIAQRDAGADNLSEMIGSAQAAVVITSLAAEYALKTLLAQTKPDKKPPKTHDLLKLFNELDSAPKLKAQKYLETLPVIGEQDWIGEQPDIRSILQMGRKNFTDWRYLAEATSVENGVPKPLINVVQALRKVCLDLILSNRG